MQFDDNLTECWVYVVHKYFHFGILAINVGRVYNPFFPAWSMTEGQQDLRWVCPHCFSMRKNLGLNFNIFQHIIWDRVSPLQGYCITKNLQRTTYWFGIHFKTEERMSLSSKLGDGEIFIFERQRVLQITDSKNKKLKLPKSIWQYPCLMLI